MRRFISVLLAVILLTACFSFAAAEQTYTNSFSLDNVTVYVPENWFGLTDSDTGNLYIYGPNGPTSGYIAVGAIDLTGYITGYESDAELWSVYQSFAASQGITDPGERFTVDGKTAFYCVYGYTGEGYTDQPAYMFFLIAGKKLYVCSVMFVSEAEARTILSGVKIK